MVRQCQEQGQEVLGTVRNTLSLRTKSANHTSNDHACYVQVDLKSAPDVSELVQQFQPEVVFHLAAQSSTSRSWENPVETYENNVLPQVNLLEACARLEKAPRVLIAGSSDEYGVSSNRDSSIAETQALAPFTPYGVTKVAQDVMARQYFLAVGMPTVVVRPFLIVGPGRSDQFFSGAFARQVASIKAGLQPPVVEVGNIDLVRDITDVRDVARGCIELIQDGEAGEAYNIGSQRGTVLRWLLEEMMRVARVEAEVRERDTASRHHEPAVIVANCSKLHRRIDWRPNIALEESVRDMLTDWSNRLLEGGVVA